MKLVKNVEILGTMAWKVCYEWPHNSCASIDTEGDEEILPLPIVKYQ